MRTVTARVVAGIVAVLSLVVLPASPASADSGQWVYTPCCDRPVWWHANDHYDYGAEKYWTNAYEWYIDWGVWGYDIWNTFGPIQDEYAWSGWEYGPFGHPWSQVYTAYYEGPYPVFRQGFERGYIDWHSRNLCLCYDYGGYVTSYLY